MHRAMDRNEGLTFFVDLHKFVDKIFILLMRVADVVNNHIIWLRPSIF